MSRYWYIGILVLVLVAATATTFIFLGSTIPIEVTTTTTTAAVASTPGGNGSDADKLPNLKGDWWRSINLEDDLGNSTSAKNGTRNHRKELGDSNATTVNVGPPSPANSNATSLAVGSAASPGLVSIQPRGETESEYSSGRLFYTTIFNDSRDDEEKTTLTLGYMMAIKGEIKDKQGLAISGAISMAIDEINSDPNLLPNVRLALRWKDTRGDTVRATRAMTEMICDGISSFFGPEGNCHVESIVAQSRNIPMFSYRCSDYMASSIPTFARTEPPDTQVTKSIISLLNYYGWKKFSIIHEEMWATVAESLKEQAEKQNMTINHNEKVIDNHKCCENEMDCCRTGYWYQVVQNTMNRTRIYVFLGPVYALVNMMEAMDAMKMFQDGQYMVIFVDMMTYSEREAQKYIWKPEHLIKFRSCNEVGNFKQRARSLLVIVSSPPTNNYEVFTEKVRAYNTKLPFNFSTPWFLGHYRKFVSINAAYLYDAVRLYALSLDQLLRREQQELTDEVIRDVASNGTRIIENIIYNKTYKSVTGATIKIDGNGDSEGNFSVLAFKEQYSSQDNFTCDFHMVPVAYFIQNDPILEYKIINASVKIDWPGEDRPFDEPSCGFLNELCPRDDTHITSMLIAGILAVMLFCASVIAISVYRRWKIEQEIEGLLWKIQPNEIKGFFANDIISSPSKLSLVSAASFGSRGSNQMFTSTAQFRGVVVRIKELTFAKKKDISREVMKEMRLLRELRHDNINSFIGACVEKEGTIQLVTDYCAKGSLYDIIENEDIKLDDLFIASLVHDLIKAMIYIHNSALIYHGNLKSSNCVVTSRWVLQVTDFGLHELRHSAESGSIGEHQHYRNQFWKAPELLRNPYIYGSPKADVYAFAIILYEIIGRKGPFGLTTIEPKEIIELVKRVPDSAEQCPFRPDLDCIMDVGVCPDYVLTCIQECWSEVPESRPDFGTIRTSLKKMRGGKSKNIMDQMMDMMEKYTNNLEEIVTDRTRLLCEEKKKTEELLHRMLPQSVAEKLTRGSGVEPVSFEKVTIYFSDIVGFTAMSAESTPLQVVNFLNDLYTIFDRIIKGYDVYKVETIGDAYMVVSGLPIENQNRHAGEIASMALELLGAIKSYRIAHRPDQRLMLRIGIHTGPVVAGVVGLTMPRYCLFGDTVNTASRMESSGQALMIHVSEECYKILIKLGGYLLVRRGYLSLKGKGVVTTWWLIGATSQAIQKKPVFVEDLPPPLFSRPRKSPKCDSRQPSLVTGSCFGLQSGGQRQGSLMHYSDRTVPAFNQGSKATLTGYRDQQQWHQLEAEMGGGGGLGQQQTQHSVSMDDDRHNVNVNAGSQDNGKNNHNNVDDAFEDGEDNNSEPSDLTRQLVPQEDYNSPDIYIVPSRNLSNSGRGNVDTTQQQPRTLKNTKGSVSSAGYNDTFKTFHREKHASFNASQLLQLRESRSLDVIPLSKPPKRRSTFRKLTSKLAFNNSNNKHNPQKTNSDSDSSSRVDDGRVKGGGGMSDALTKAAETISATTTPNTSSSSSNMISKLNQLVSSDTDYEHRNNRSRNQLLPSDDGRADGGHTVIHCNGFDDCDSEPLLGPAGQHTTPLSNVVVFRQKEAPKKQQQQQPAADDVEYNNKKWRSLNEVHERNYVFDSARNSGSTDDRSLYGGGFGDGDVPDSGDPASVAVSPGRRATSTAPDSNLVAGWWKGIFNNGNNTDIANNYKMGIAKQNNLLIGHNNNNNNNNSQSSINQNHKQFNLNANLMVAAVDTSTPSSVDQQVDEIINSPSAALFNAAPLPTIECRSAELSDAIPLSDSFVSGGDAGTGMLPPSLAADPQSQQLQLHHDHCVEPDYAGLVHRKPFAEAANCSLKGESLV